MFAWPVMGVAPAAVWLILKEQRHFLSPIILMALVILLFAATADCP